MSSVGGAGSTGRIVPAGGVGTSGVTGPATTPAEPTTPAAGSGAATRTSGRAPTPDAATSRIASRVATATRAPTGPAVALGKFGDASVEARPDGTILLKGAAGADTSAQLEALRTLALRPADAGGPFDKITDKALLEAISKRLADQHKALSAEPGDDATRLEWRQGRAAALHLLEAAAVRAKALGDDGLSTKLAKRLVDTAKAEPWKQLRDFAYESLISRAEAKEVPEASARTAKDAIYPAKPPYDKWMADGKIRVQMYIDNDGSLLEDQLDFYKDIGFKVKKNADGSYLATRKGENGKPPLELVIPKPGGKDKPPELFEKMADPSIDVICYCGHAGYGHRVDSALAKGVGGTGDGKAVILLQCWGHGNVESLERAYPDAQMLSTTAPTTDNHDWLLLERAFDGFQAKKGWEDIQKKTTGDLKEVFKDDPEYPDPSKLEGHYFYPTTRSLLVTKYDRDGDGTNDEKDHIFNVVYPKRIDAAGGYDPVAQAVPKYALDGTALNKAVNVLSLVTRYNHLLPPEQERKLPWKPEAWESGGFFEPAAGDLRAVQFNEDPRTGKVKVALSTRFAHTSEEDLSRMAAYEMGLWMADKAGLAGKDKTTLALGTLERALHQQGTNYGSQGTLDEPFAEETLFKQRYGLPDSFTFAELEKVVGDPDDYKPEHFKKLSDSVKNRAGIAEAAGKAPARVGGEVAIPAGREMRFSSTWVDKADITRVLNSLGVAGEVESFSPSWLQQNQPNNLVALVKKPDGKTVHVGISTDSQGVVRAASTLDLRVDKLLDKTAVDYFAGVAQSTGAAAAGLEATYRTERAAGKSVGDAIAKALETAKPRMRAGARPSTPYELSSLARNGLVLPAEYEKVNHAIARLFA